MNSLWMGLSSARMRWDISPAGDNSDVSGGGDHLATFYCWGFFSLLWIPSLQADIFTHILKTLGESYKRDCIISEKYILLYYYEINVK